LDWLGIHATRLNGHLVRTLFREIAYPVVLKNPMRVPLRWQGKILVAAGWKPGWSTDYVACRIAKRLGVDSIINASNIDYVYDRDPNKYKNAKKIEEMAWKDFRKIVGDDWDPGKSAPFDPVASKFCHKNKIKVAIVNGVDIKNVGNVLSGRLFQGTLLS
ncbi:MAG: UMP kinase, partial [Patescibacteria group bacterium]